MDVKVSVVVPVYNTPEGLFKQCIESLLSQTLKEIEIILVDDGSTDGSGKTIDGYAAKDRRITVIHKGNRGLSAARNSGIKIAVGEYVTFVDSDDFLEKDALETALTEAERSGAEIVTFGITEDYLKSSVPCDCEGIAEGIYKGEECKYLQAMVLDFNAHISTAYAKLIKKDFLINNNIFHDEELRQGAEGVEFCLRLFDKAERVSVLKKNLYHYVYNSSSISSSHDEKNHQAVLNCFNKISEFIEKSEEREKLENKLYDRLLYVVITTAISGYFNPNNKESFSVKKAKYRKFLKEPIIVKSLKKGNKSSLSGKRKITLFLIRTRMFLLVSIIAKINKKRKDSK